VLEYALRFDFPALSTEVEYEALIIGITMCKVAAAERIKA